ncbi:MULTISPECIES: hypothetical protein [unclassified Caulobacter]|uniref:hypothetical protein n=1 Tax=unclassified Caulobacter TaxID=2648921 RepID=UPI001304E9BD|nr:MULTISPECIES: hypothetical protein [unclassified Caulobacter]
MTLRSVPEVAKARIIDCPPPEPSPMLAILIIAAFLGVIFALNLTEFGRVD